MNKMHIINTFTLFMIDDILEYALIYKRPLMEIMKQIKRGNFLVIHKNYKITLP